MANITLSTVEYAVFGTMIVPSTGVTVINSSTANTYTLPGVAPGFATGGQLGVPGGYPVGYTFGIVNAGSATLTFVPASGFTVSGATTCTTDQEIRFVYTGSQNWNGVLQLVNSGSGGGGGSGTVSNVSSTSPALTVANPTTTPTITPVFGTSANTIAQGNDSRIVNALQNSTTAFVPTGIIETAVTSTTATPITGTLNLYDCTNNAITVTLPASSTLPAGTIIGVSKIDSTSNIITVALSGSDHFDSSTGSTSTSVKIQNQKSYYRTDGVSIWIKMFADFSLPALTSYILTSPALTGVPTAPTAATGTNTTQVATTAFVVANNSPSFTVIKATSSGNVPASTSVWASGLNNIQTIVAGTNGQQYRVSNINSSGGSNVTIAIPTGTSLNGTTNGTQTVAPGYSYTIETDGTNFILV